MPGTGDARDKALIDALEALVPARFSGTVWRVVRDGRDPCQCSATGGRWDDGTFDVLYTSASADGAVAEAYFHLSRGQPVVPSKVRYRLHELRGTLERALRFPDLAALSAVGMDTARYGQLSYLERSQEYPRSQEVAEAAHFLGFDGMIVPCARWPCMNVVLFCDQLGGGAWEAVKEHGSIDWRRWQAEPFGY